MARSIDPTGLATALKSLLVALSGESSIEAATMTAAEIKRLRLDINTAIERLIPLSRELDPIKRPTFVFDPTNPEIVGNLIGRTMMEQPRHPLGAVAKFYGAGVYAIYYNGDFDAYAPIRRKDTPIYAGKADPPTPDAKTVEEQGPKLSARLAEHAKSIKAAAGTLRIADFDCRYLVVQSGWQRAAEDYLLHLFRPIWNLERFDISYSVACVLEEAAAIGGGDGCDGGGDRLAQCLGRAGGGGSQRLLHLAPEVFDRVEVRAVRWQIDQTRARRLDRFANGRRLVSRKIVHHHHVSGSQLRAEVVVDPGGEAVGVDGTVQGSASERALDSHRADHRRRLPVTCRPGCDATLATR
jgi:hypothetical protein